MTARIVIISGATGTGKTSISRILAENSTYDRAVHITIGVKKYLSTRSNNI